MRHYPDFSTLESRSARLARLFELHRQADLQEQATAESVMLLPDVERMIKARALASLRQPRDDAMRGRLRG